MKQTNSISFQLLEEIAMEAHEDLGDDLRDMPGKNRREPGLVEGNEVSY